MTQPTTSSRRRMLLGLIAAGVLTLVLAIVVVVVLVLPAIFGGGAADEAQVVDITSEPEITWTYQWVADNNPDFLDDTPDITSIGADQALVWPVFDLAAYSDAIGTSLGWYPGYDTQYDEGYVAGVAYHEADEAYRNDTFPYTVPPANPQDFYPEGADDNDDEFLGFQDGFSDGSLQRGAGANKREKPVDPGYTPVMTLVNAVNGEPVWSADISKSVESADYTSVFSAYDIVGSNAIAVVVSSPNSEPVEYALITLDKGDGSVLSSLTAEGQIVVAGLDGDIIISIADDDGGSSTIGRYSVTEVDDDPRWEVEVDGAPFLSTDNGYVIAYGEDSGAVFNGSDGTKATWGDDISFTVFYEFIGDQLVRGENRDDGKEYEIFGWSTDGESAWPTPVTASYTTVFGGSIFTAELDGDSYSSLQRLNPADGSEMWSAPYADAFDAFLAVQGSSLLVSRGHNIVVLDLASGAERFVQKAGDFFDIYEGSSLYYVPAGEQFVAYRYDDEGEVWSFGLSDSESVTTLGDHLVLIDYDRSALLGLAAR